MLSLTVPYKAGHHTLGRVCVGEGLGSEEGYFIMVGREEGAGVRGLRLGGQGGGGGRETRSPKSGASMIPPNPERTPPTVQPCLLYML